MSGKDAAVKLGLHISNFACPEGAPRPGAMLGDVASPADQAGFDGRRDTAAEAL
jgi:hypothetical protein